MSSTQVLQSTKQVYGYHVTSASNAISIYQNGFQLGASKGLGEVWGRGVYLSLDKRTTRFYLKKCEDSVRVAAKALLHHPLYVTPDLDWGDDGVQILHAIAMEQGCGELVDEYGDYTFEYWSIFRPLQAEWLAFRKAFNSEHEYPRASHDFARSLGYDSLLITAPDNTDWWHTGGSQLLVFDPEQVTVIP